MANARGDRRGGIANTALAKSRLAAKQARQKRWAFVIIRSVMFLVMVIIIIVVMAMTAHRRCMLFLMMIIVVIVVTVAA